MDTILGVFVQMSGSSRSLVVEGGMMAEAATRSDCVRMTQK